MALTADRNTPEKAGVLFEFPAAADAKIYAGALVVLDAGYAKPGATDTGLVAVGRAEEGVDNTDGADGAVNVKVKGGVFRFGNSAGTDEIALSEVGSKCYVVDDETVAKTSATNTRSVAGQVVDVDAAGVWVRF